MAKIQIKSERLTPLGGIFSIKELFDSLLSLTIDSTLGLRCTSYGYHTAKYYALLCAYIFVAAHALKMLQHTL